MKQVIAKAMKGGLDEDVLDAFRLVSVTQNDDYINMAFNFIIFSHDFLRAYYGEGKTNCVECSFGKIAVECEGDCPEAWEAHAQQLVLAEDRLAYLRRT